MQGEMTVRLADTSDVPAICALINSAYRGDESKKGWSTETDLVGGGRTDEPTVTEMMTAGNVFLVARDDEGLLASLHLENRGDHAYLGLLSVRPTQQATGLGRRMLAEAEGWVRREWGVRRMRISVVRQRTELVEWYERRGYVRTGEVWPFDINDERFGIPKVEGLEFCALEKDLS
jgi:GNAT superfamily N-acetyltransferase